MLGLGDGGAVVAGTEVDLRGLANLLPEHGLKPVLREDGGVDRAQRQQRVDVGRQRRAAPEFPPRERGDPAYIGPLEDVLARCDDAIGLSDLAKHLERPRIEDAGCRVRLGLGIALDQRHPDAGPGKKQRKRQSRRPGANHDNPAGSVRHPSFVPLRHLICSPSLPIMHDTQPLGAPNAVVKFRQLLPGDRERAANVGITRNTANYLVPVELLNLTSETTFEAGRYQMSNSVHWPSGLA